MQSTKHINTTVAAQTFALTVSDSHVDRYSISSISFPILSTGQNNIFTNIYILSKQPTLSRCNIAHSILPL